MGEPGEVTAHCVRCGTMTKHRRDELGKLHCVRCTLEESVSGTDPNAGNTPYVSRPAIPMSADEPRPRVADEPRKRWSRAELIAAVITVLVVGFLIYAFVKRP